MAQKDRVYSPLRCKAVGGLRTGALAERHPRRVRRVEVRRRLRPAKNGILETFIYKNDHFAKTGSGQT